MNYPQQPFQGGMPQQPMPGAPMQAPYTQAPYPQAPPMPPPGGQVAAPPQTSWQQRAEQRTSFLTQVRVEFRKLAGTTSDRVLLIIGPLVLIGFTIWLPFTGMGLETAKDQIGPAVWAVRMAAVVLHAVLIKLIAGEWQHRSAQPTLLVQPSRARYFLAQATVVLTVWVAIAAIQIAITFIIMPIAVAPEAGYLLDYRPGWVIGVILVGSFLTIMTALIVSMLVPNAAGALAVYFGAVPAMLILSGVASTIFIWLDPLAPMMTLATWSDVHNIGPAISSLAIWGALLGAAIWRVSRRDLA